MESQSRKMESLETQHFISFHVSGRKYYQKLCIVVFLQTGEEFRRIDRESNGQIDLKTFKRGGGGILKFSLGKICIKHFRNTFQRSDRSSGGGRPAKHADPNGTHLFKPTTTNLLLYEAPVVDNKIGFIGQICFQNLSVCSLKGRSFYYVYNASLGL